MTVRMLFVIGAPRSGTTMLERMLSSHSMIQGGPEPHLLTPLAHLGVWAKVDKAPYDHILAAESQKLFVGQLPRGEADYWEACRAYCDVIYGRYLEAKGGRPICLDKTPAYALVLPFLEKVFPDAGYVVLTRHPLAVFSSYANSFFEGDYAAAHDFNPILERYVPAMADFLRRAETPHVHVRYEDLVTQPEEWFRRICEHLAVPFEAEAIDYGKKPRQDRPEGLGDPLGVQQHSRPSTASLDKWPRELAASPEKLALMKRVIDKLVPDDLVTLGYPPAEIWKPMEALGPDVKPPRPPKASKYRFQRRMIMRLRARARKGGAFRRLLEKMRLGCEVLLREK